MTWKTGPVGNVQRAILCDQGVVAVADTMQDASYMVRLLNQAERGGQTREVAELWDALYVLANGGEECVSTMEIMGVLSRYAPALPTTKISE